MFPCGSSHGKAALSHGVCLFVFSLRLARRTRGDGGARRSACARRSSTQAAAESASRRTTSSTAEYVRTRMCAFGNTRSGAGARRGAGASRRSLGRRGCASARGRDAECWPRPRVRGGAEEVRSCCFWCKDCSASSGISSAPVKNGLSLDDPAAGAAADGRDDGRFFTPPPISWLDFCKDAKLFTKKGNNSRLSSLPYTVQRL